MVFKIPSIDLLLLEFNKRDWSKIGRTVDSTQKNISLPKVILEH